jgi:hypothetical protein
MALGGVTSRRERLRRQATRLWQGLFPPEVLLPHEARQRLAALYPALDFQQVHFHRGVPGFLRGRTEGIVLPGSWSPVGSHVYIRRDLWHLETRAGISLLAHEAFHALQMQEAGPGLGFLRPFLVLYLACAAGNRFVYRGHPLEEPAYSVAGRRRSRLERCLRDGVDPEPVAASGLRFWQLLVSSVPGGRRARGPVRGLFAALSLQWLLLWGGVTVVLWAAWLTVGVVGAAVAGAMWVAGAKGEPS